MQVNWILRTTEIKNIKPQPSSKALAVIFTFNFFPTYIHTERDRTPPEDNTLTVTNPYPHQ